MKWRAAWGMMIYHLAFAGSAKLLNQRISVLTEVVCIPLPEATRMVT